MSVLQLRNVTQYRMAPTQPDRPPLQDHLKTTAQRIAVLPNRMEISLFLLLSSNQVLFGRASQPAECDANPITSLRHKTSMRIARNSPLPMVPTLRPNITVCHVRTKLKFIL